MAGGEGLQSVELGGKTAIVTGGSKGIGKATAMELAREGVDLEQTDFVRLTESFGGVGWKVETLEQFDHAFAAALESDRLHVIDVRVDADVYASHIKPIRGI